MVLHLGFPSTGITGLCHHTHLYFQFIRDISGWFEDSVGEALATQARQPECNPGSHVKVEEEK